MGRRPIRSKTWLVMLAALIAGSPANACAGLTRKSAPHDRFLGRVYRSTAALARARLTADRIVANLASGDGREWGVSSESFTLSGFVRAFDHRLLLHVRFFDGSRPSRHRAGHVVPEVFLAVRMAAEDLARAHDLREFEIGARATNARMHDFLTRHLGFESTGGDGLRIVGDVRSSPPSRPAQTP